MTEGNHENNPNYFGQPRDLKPKPFEYDSNVMNFDRRYALCIQKLYQRPHSTVGGSWTKSLHSNRCNDATVRTREVLLVYASCNVIILSLTRSRFTQ